MVSCSASGCSNRGEKGFSMKSFPRDPNIRKQWQENVNRIGWEPTENSKLCEMHFLPEMWEKPRVDGKKKLKWNALPTVFPLKSTKPKSKMKKNAPIFFVASNVDLLHTEQGTQIPEHTTDPLIATKVSGLSDSLHVHQNSFVSEFVGPSNMPRNTIVNVENPTQFHNYAQPPINETKQMSQAVQANYESIAKINSSSDFTESFVSDVTMLSTLNNTDLYKKMYHYQKAYTQLLSKIDTYKEQIKVLKRKNEKLVKIAMKDRHLRLLKRVFNDDQICAMERTNCRFMKWSQSTLINALRLKNYCGKDGYEEILRQKIPLPSIRTLNRIKIIEPVNCVKSFST